MLESSSIALAPPKGRPARSGDRWGRYTIDKPMSVGGMAELLLARTKGPGGFEKLVVLKRILPQLATDEEFVARFLQEARIVANLEHPNIVGVYDVGEHEGAYFFAMEYVDGPDLRRLLTAARQNNRPLSLDEVVTIGIDLCAALHYAHNKNDASGKPLGIVHRDVTPSNILITRTGTIKLLDFGIAKAAVGLVSTAAGRLRGKIPYMSPEQAQGKSVDRRADVFSLGVVLWELLGLRRAVVEGNELEMLRRIVEEDVPDVRSSREDCPPQLAAIVARALRRDPAQRYPTAVSLLEELEDFAMEHRLRTSPRVLVALQEDLLGSEEGPRFATADPGAPTATYGPTQLGIGKPEAPKKARPRGAGKVAVGLAVALTVTTVAWAIAQGEVSAIAAGGIVAAPRIEFQTPVLPTPVPAQAEPVPEAAQIKDAPPPTPVKKRRARRGRKPAKQRSPSKAALESPLPPGFNPGSEK